MLCFLIREVSTNLCSTSKMEAGVSPENISNFSALYNITSQKTEAFNVFLLRSPSCPKIGYFHLGSKTQND
jgi:hypothetical protein